MKTYQKQIGDGKLPNKYWVFQYEQKYKRVKQEDGSIVIEIIKESEATEDGLIGEYKTFQEALGAVDNKAYLPNVVIEDRLSGQVFESLVVVVCQECGKEEYESHTDINFTKKKIEEAGKKFE